MKRYRFAIVLMTILCLSAARPGLADDTDIYGGGSISVNPNVLIIFDNSGSMATEDVPGDPYDKDTTYTGIYDSETVYRRYCSSRWNCSYYWFASGLGQLNCPDVKDELEANGYVRDNIRNQANGYTCGGSTKSLFVGNWLNYDRSGVAVRSRIEVAKEVITDLVNTTANVNFGLMVFNFSQGGRVVKPIGSTQAELVDAIDDLEAENWTPLAETLAEAGLYYAGKTSWFNSGTYTSPIQNRCQKNYIILMTDGEPTYDRDSKLSSAAYINGNTIGDYDNDGNDPGPQGSDYASDYLDDVAAYLFQEDLRSDLGTAGESFERQNVITYTIGFQSDQELLGQTAANGGGQYYTADSIGGLQAAFQQIMASIADVNAVFVSPVVPVSRMNRTFAGNSLYVGFFKPQISGRWDGNIKKYGLDAQGNLVDQFGAAATLADGAIRDNAQSYWSDQPDGPNVLLGGTGEVMLDQSSRNLYTYLGTTPHLQLSNNAFEEANSSLTQAILDVGDAAERTSVINDTHGTGRSWLMGDILHSQPAVVYYDTDADSVLDEAFIYAGSNDGILHAFKDSDGTEQWGFIPPDQLERLKLLSDGVATHEYYVDGAPVVHEDFSTGAKILIFGERRGGYSYHALDVQNPVEPDYKYQIRSDHLINLDWDNDNNPDGAAAMLGQSWATPTKARIKTGPLAANYADVFILAGGYDTNQDNQSPAATDAVGRAVFAVNVNTGAVTALNMNAAHHSDMTHSIVDVSGFDSSGNGYLNRIYAGDLGGNMFAMEDDNGDGTWSIRKFFSASADDGIADNNIDDGVQKKILYAPDATREIVGDMIFFGTGDRADPEETGVVNRIYAIKNDWMDPNHQDYPGTLTETDLADVTDNLLYLGNETQRANAQQALNNSKGWYIRLENPGEKVTASVTVFAGVVYFTTYTPESGGPPPADPCAAASGRGTARLYAVNYLDGSGANDWSSVAEYTADTTPQEVAPGKGKLDRSKIIGTSIPSAPVIAVLPGGAKMYIGVEGGVAKQDPTPVADVNAYYWRQLYY